MKLHTLGDAPIEPEYQRQMEAVARALDGVFNRELKGHARKTGFVLMVFPFGEGGRTNYISNANRAQVLTLLKEQVARFEGRYSEKGNA